MWDDNLPDPYDADFYARYVEVCHRAGIEPSLPQRVCELVRKWNAVLRGESGEAEACRAPYH